MIFIVSSTGILVYRTHCACTGTEQIGLYVKPETCEIEIHSHEVEDFAMETAVNCCHDCTPQSHDCGCSSPEVHFFKLINDFTQKGISFERTPDSKINDIILIALVHFVVDKDFTENKIGYSEGPPIIKSSKNFLIEVNQLKIPHSA